MTTEIDELTKLDLEIEDFTNDAIALIWPMLDAGVSKSEVYGAIQNVMDSWEPERSEREDEVMRCRSCGFFPCICDADERS